MLAAPTKINQWIGMRIQLQQVWHQLALQTTESRGCPECFTRRSYGVDRNMRGEIYPRPSYRLQGTTIPVRRK